MESVLAAVVTGILTLIGVQNDGAADLLAEYSVPRFMTGSAALQPIVDG